MVYNSYKTVVRQQSGIQKAQRQQSDNSHVYNSYKTVVTTVRYTYTAVRQHKDSSQTTVRYTTATKTDNSHVYNSYKTVVSQQSGIQKADSSQTRQQSCIRQLQNSSQSGIQKAQRQQSDNSHVYNSYKTVVKQQSGIQKAQRQQSATVRQQSTTATKQ